MQGLLLCHATAGCEVNLNNSAANCGAVSWEGLHGPQPVMTQGHARGHRPAACTHRHAQLPEALAAGHCFGCCSGCGSAPVPAIHLHPSIQCGNACETYQKCVGGKKQCSEFEPYRPAFLV